MFLTLPAMLLAGPTAPCTGGKSNETVLPVTGATQTYCVSDFGWSDTWFSASTPSSYIQTQDVLSGDDAPFVRYLVNSAPGHGQGFLSPSLDNGTFDSTLIGSPWQVISGLSYVAGFGTSKVSSVIQENTDPIQIMITTQVIGSFVTLKFDIVNTSASAIISNLQFGDYFNFHPDGSNDATDAAKGTTRFLAGGVVFVTSPQSATHISDGSMQGSFAPSSHHIDTQVGTVNAINTDVYNNLNGPCGPADCAAALKWDLGTLGPGQSTSFTITKDAVPEPGTWSMVSIAAIGLALARRRNRRAVGVARGFAFREPAA